MSFFMNIMVNVSNCRVRQGMCSWARRAQHPFLLTLCTLAHGTQGTSINSVPYSLCAACCSMPARSPSQHMPAVFEAPCCLIVCAYVQGSMFSVLPFESRQCAPGCFCALPWRRGRGEVTSHSSLRSSRPKLGRIPGETGE